VVSKAELFGRALGKAVRHTVSGMKEPETAPVMYRVNMADVPAVENLSSGDGWVDAQVQVLVDRHTAQADHMLGRTVLRPGARHGKHRHRNCDAFLIVLEGNGMLGTDAGDKPAGQGDVIFLPRGCWHGFSNTSDADVVLLWGLMAPARSRSPDIRRSQTLTRNRNMNAWDDPRIARGMETQLAARRARIAAGERPIGWKVGLGAAAAMQRLGIKAPLVGYMMEKSLLPDGASVPVGAWTQPVAEPEIAVYMAADLPGGADRAATIAAIGSLGAAIELADLDPTPPDVEEALAGNIFHRHVILGPADPARAGVRLDGLAGVVFRRGKEAARQVDLQANIGEIVGIVTHVAGTLSAYGERLRAGDVIITGSIVAPPRIEKDETEFAYALEPMKPLSVRFTR
jgi:2-keto-4-pentenoate hydratase